MKLYLAITRDKYELPLAVADSPNELARMCGVKPNNVSSAISNWKSGKRRRSCFICVDIEDGEESYGECEPMSLGFPTEQGANAQGAANLQ